MTRRHTRIRWRPIRLCAVFVQVAVCLVFLGSTTADAAEREDTGLTESESKALLQAYERDDLVAMRAIIIAAIATHSDRSAAIVRESFRLVPLRAAGIVDQAAKTFPPLAERLKAVAEEITGAKKKKAMKDARAEPARKEELAPKAEFAPKEDGFGTWSGETVVGGNYRSGAQDLLSLHAAFKVTQVIGRWKNTGEVKFDLARADGVTNSQDLEIKGRLRRDIDEKLYGFGIAAYEDDRFSGFEYQITEGVGVGYQLFDTESFRLSLEGGPSVRHNLVSRTDEFNNEILLRLAGMLEWDISDTAKLSNETALLLTRNSIELDTRSFGQVSDSSESTNTTALDMQIIGNLAARLSYELHFRSDPPPGAQTTESTARISLVHNF